MVDIDMRAVLAKSGLLHDEMVRGAVSGPSRRKMANGECILTLWLVVRCRGKNLRCCRWSHAEWLYKRDDAHPSPAVAASLWALGGR